LSQYRNSAPQTISKLGKRIEFILDGEIAMKHSSVRQMRGGRSTLMVLVGLASALGLVLPPAVSAADLGACAASAQSRQLYYWLGDWVVSYSGAPRGSSSKVHLALDKCLFVENWQDGNGHKGENFLAFGADDQSWRALFADNRGRLHIFTEGKVAGGSAEFLGPSRGPNGESILNRLKLVRVNKNSLEQTWEKSADGGLTWTSDFMLAYSRDSS
jgi:hypothetical protein